MKSSPYREICQKHTKHEKYQKTNTKTCKTTWQMDLSKKWKSTIKREQKYEKSWFPTAVFKGKKSESANNAWKYRHMSYS